MASVNINVRVDEDVKSKAEYLFDDLGVNMTTAVNMFLKACIRYDGIPFELKMERPNSETLEAIEEVQMLKANPNKKTYNSFAEILGELDND